MILIAIESRTVRAQVERLCAQAGLPSIAVGTLKEARQVLAGTALRAAVLDDWFPDGRGEELLAELRGAAGDALPVLSIGSEAANADAALQPDVRVAKGEIGTRLVAELKASLKEHARETSLGRVLVVDDSLTYRQQLKAALEAGNYTVLLAETGEEGVRCAFEQAPDAILVDFMLPGISGAAVIRRLRSESATRRTPCVLLTASADAREEVEALEAGADTFVRKDEAMEVILARLAGVLRSASTPAATSLAALPQLPRRVVLAGEAVGAGRPPLEGVGAVLRDEGCETVELKPERLRTEQCAVLEPDVVVFATAVDETALEFCREFKRLPGLRNSRLILVDQAESGHASVAAIGAGADDYLMAASGQAVLLARVRSQLRRKRTEDENRGLRDHMLRQEMETEAQRALAEARSRHADEMRVAYSLAEEKAHEAERARLELEQVTEGIPQIVWTSRADGQGARFNRRWTDFTGLPHLDVDGHVWRRVIHREDVVRALRDWRSSVRGGLPYSSEYRLRSAAGDYRWFLVRAIPLVDETGKIDRWFGTCTDIDDQKVNEEALRRTEKLAATGRLAASIAHEINNPLEAVTNLLYLIEQNTRGIADTHDFVTTAQKEVDRVAQISKKTLAFYRESTQAGPVDLCGLVQEVLEIYSVRLQRKQMQVLAETDCTAQPQGLAGELRQVISNLVTNAIEASPAGAVLRVRVRATRTRGEGGVEGVRVTVSDGGHGIPRAVQAEIFKPFVTTKGQQGTGLGLWLSHSILKRHGGLMQMRSSTGVRHGTTFSFFVPLELKAPPAEGDSMGTMLRTIGGELLGQATRGSTG